MDIKKMIQNSRRADGCFRANAEVADALRAAFPGLEKTPVPELAFMYMNGMCAPKSCPSGHPHTFLSEIRGYRPTCGVKGCPHNTSEGRTRNRSEINKASAKKFRDRTGLASPSQLPGVGDRVSAGGKKIGKDRYRKIRATMIERYGVGSYLSMPGVQDSGQSVAWDDDARTRRSDTNVERYGSGNPMGNVDVRRRCIDSFIERYGVDNPMRVPEIAERATRAFERNMGTDVIRERMRDAGWWQTFEKASAARSEIDGHFEYSRGHLGKIIKANRPDLITRKEGPMEAVVASMIKSLGVECIIGDRTVIRPKEIDVLVPSCNVGIEVNGMYWHSEVGGGRGSTYHADKCESALKSGVRLIQFWDREVIERPDLVASIIASACGKAARIFARSTHVVELMPDEERNFMQENHLQGYVPSSFAYGLVHKGVIVAAMSFGKSRYDKNHEWELLRYCNLSGHVVVGGARKLFKRRPPGDIISYSDRRIFGGGMYEKLGMKKIGTSKPGYRYTKDYKETHSRVKYQKHKLSGILEKFDGNLTEWENMKANGYDRLWDCGNFVWSLGAAVDAARPSGHTYLDSDYSSSSP